MYNIDSRYGHYEGPGIPGGHESPFGGRRMPGGHGGPFSPFGAHGGPFRSHRMPGGHEGPSGGRRFGRSGLGRRGPRDSFDDYDSADEFDSSQSGSSDDDSIFDDLGRGPGRREPGGGGFSRRPPMPHARERMTTEEAERIMAEGRGGREDMVAQLILLRQRYLNGRGRGGFGGPGRMQTPNGAGGQRVGLGGWVDEPPGARGGMHRPSERPEMLGRGGRPGTNFATTYAASRNRHRGFGMGRYPRGGRPSSRDDFDDDGFASEGEFDDSF